MGGVFDYPIFKHILVSSEAAKIMEKKEEAIHSFFSLFLN